MAYPFESSIVLTNAACNLIFASETSYITESSSGQLDIYAGSTNVMIITSSSMTLTTGAFIDTIDEYTTDAGVTVEGVLIKDSDITLQTIGDSLIFGDGDTYIYESADDDLAFIQGDYNALRINDEQHLTIGRNGGGEERLTVDYGHLRFNVIPTNLGTLTATLAGDGAGNVDDGVHGYTVVFVDVDGGETAQPTVHGDVTVVDNTTDGQVDLTNIPTADSKYNIVSRKIYRSKADASWVLGYLLTTINDNTTTTYTDNTADASLGTESMYRKEQSNSGQVFLDSERVMYFGDVFRTLYGYGAGQSLTSGGSVALIGGNAGASLTTGHSSTFIGYHAGYSITTGNSNVAIGYAALGTIPTNVSYNIAIGNAVLSQATGSYNVSLGDNALVYGGSGTIAMGYRAGRYLSGNYNVALGYYAGSGVAGTSTGTDNIFIGRNAGDSITTGSYNIIIGSLADLDNPASNYSLKIGRSTTIILEGNTASSSEWIGSAYDFKIDTIKEYTGSAGVTIESTIYATGLGDDDTEDHIVAIDDSTGLLTKRAVSSLPSGSGDVSWGTASNSYIVYGSSGGDIQSTSDFNYNPTTNKVQINGGASDGGKLTLTYNTGDNLILTTTSTYGQLTGDNHILFTPGTGSGIGFGAGVVATNYITIRDSDGTYGTTNILDIQSSAGSSLFEFRVDGSLYFTTLGSDDTEDHVLAIDDSTGLVTKRAVSTLAGSGDVSWGTATNKYLVFGSASGDIESSSSLVYDTSASELTIGPATGFTQIGITSGLVMGGSTTSDYYRFYESAGLLRIDWDDNDAFSTFDSIVSISQALELIDLRWDVCITSGNTLTFDGQSGDSYIYDNAGDLTFRDASNTGGVTLSTLTSGILEVGLSGEIPYTNSTPDDFDYSSNFKYSAGILTLSNITMSAAAGTTNYGLVLGAVTTGAMSVQANLEYSTTDEALYIGGRTSLYTNWGTTNLVLGNTTSGDKANIEFVGNQSTDTNIGSMTWHNSTSGETYNRLAQFSVYRDGDNDAGAFVWHTATAAGTLVQRMELDSSGLLNLATTATALTGGLLNVASSAMTYAGTFFSDGNSASYKGIKIQAGADTAQSPAGPPGSSTFVDMYDGDGTQLGYIYGDAAGVYIQAASDKRLKTNISKLSRNAEEIIMGVEVAEFNWKHSPDAAKITGYVAQDVAEIFPEMMHHDIETDLYTVSPAKLIPYMHKVIQNQNHRIDELEKLINKL